MGDLKQPDTQREMIYQLWYAVLGSNGDGIAETVRRIERRVDNLEESAATRKELAEAIRRAEEADAAQDMRHQWVTGQGERRKGNHIALWALVVAGLSVVSTIVLATIGG